MSIAPLLIAPMLLSHNTQPEYEAKRGLAGGAYLYINIMCAPSRTPSRVIRHAPSSEAPTSKRTNIIAAAHSACGQCGGRAFGYCATRDWSCFRCCAGRCMLVPLPVPRSKLGGFSNHPASLTSELIVAVGTLGTLPEPKMSDFSAFRQVPSACRVWHAAPRWNLLEQTFAALECQAVANSEKAVQVSCITTKFPSL